MMKELQQSLSDFALSLGADDVGFCALPSPAQGFSHLPHAVSICVKLSDAVLRGIENAPTYSYFQHYRTANALLDTIAFRVSRQLEKAGFSAFPVAASQSQGKFNPYGGVYAHKTAAVCSGLGFVGKSGLFLHPNWGSKVRLATVLTDAPFTAEKPQIENGCGDCRLCADACPAGAIYGELPHADGTRNLDPEKCSYYMKTHFQDIGRGSVCGICVKVCPKNQL